MKNLQVEPTHYNHTYDSEARFISYWHQIKEVLDLNPNTFLEVGVGNGLVSSYLKKEGIKVITIDLDKRLNPDIAGNIVKLPFKQKSFDVIGCFEVLEHIPFSDVQVALKELKRVTKKYVVISLPDRERYLKFYLPLFGEFKFSFPRLKKGKHEYDGQHYWEINKKGYGLKKIKNIIESKGFEIIKTYRPWKMMAHRFFILEI